MSRVNPILPVLSLLALLPVLAGCGQSDAAAEAEVAKHRGQFVLAEEPDGARGVEDIRKAMPDDGKFVVVGRVGGRAEPWTAGKASFFMADPSLVLVSDSEHDCDDPGCAFCSDSSDKAHQKMLALIQFVDDKGNVVPVGAKDLFEIKENDMVVVRGKAEIAADGWLVVTADGLYVRR